MAQQLTTDILNAALEHLTAKRQQIDDQIAEVRRLLGSSTSDGSSAAPTGKRTISAAGRKAIAEAQKRRWAAKKEAEGATPTAKPKRKLSAAGRRAISAAAKKRWAAKKAASAQTKVATKKEKPSTAQ